MAKVFQEILNANLIQSIDSSEMMLQDAVFQRTFETIVKEVKYVLKDGGKVIVAGNGGSAADAQHLVAEMVVKQSKVRPAMSAIALSVDTSVITAIGNDFGYDKVFSRQLEALTHPNNVDIFIGISTSGNSPNMVEAFQFCKDNMITSVLLGGKNGGECLRLADFALLVPGDTSSKIQQAHQIIYHSLVDCLEA